MSLTTNQAKQELWRRGILTWKMDPFQKGLYEQIKASGEKIQVVLSSRRLGKTYAACLMATMECQQTPNCIVKILAPTKMMIDDITNSIFPQIFNDCPEILRPRQIKSKYTYVFPNGSKIQLAGNDAGHAERLRGSFAHLCIVDEAGFCSNLQNTVRSILIPTTMNTKGKILLLSTPPEDPEHEFMRFVEEADKKGTLIKKTIYDNPRIKPEEIEEIVSAYPLREKDPQFRREFLCIVEKDEKLNALPEFTPELEASIVKEWPKPPFLHTYEAMDIGGRDLTVVLFGYYDFRAAKIVVEDELVFNFQEKGNDYEVFLKQLKAKEDFLWKNVLTDELKPIHKRVSDINYVVTEELYKTSVKLEPMRPIFFEATKKDDKEAAVNNLKMMLSNEKIIINPRCKTLIQHLRYVKWSKSKTVNKFARSVGHGHYDAVDSLIYMVRSIEYSRNPYPAHYGYDLRDLHVANPGAFKPQASQVEVFRKIFRK